MILVVPHDQLGRRRLLGEGDGQRVHRREWRPDPFVRGTSIPQTLSTYVAQVSQPLARAYQTTVGVQREVASNLSIGADYVNSRLAELMGAATDQVMARADAEGLSLREAAYLIGVERVAANLMSSGTERVSPATAQLARLGGPKTRTKIVGSSGCTMRHASSAVNERIGASSFNKVSRMSASAVCAERRATLSAAAV